MLKFNQKEGMSAATTDQWPMLLSFRASRGMTGGANKMVERVDLNALGAV